MKLQCQWSCICMLVIDFLFDFGIILTVVVFFLIIVFNYFINTMRLLIYCSRVVLCINDFNSPKYLRNSEQLMFNVPTVSRSKTVPNNSKGYQHLLFCEKCSDKRKFEKCHICSYVNLLLFGMFPICRSFCTLFTNKNKIYIELQR